MIQNKYEIRKQIGHGQFGTIYEGENRRKQRVAIKMEQEDSQIKMLKQETTILHYLYQKNQRRQMDLKVRMVSLTKWEKISS